MALRCEPVLAFRKARVSVDFTLIGKVETSTSVGLECPAFVEPVALIETGLQGASDGTPEEAHA
jgi:hypothetical protein